MATWLSPLLRPVTDWLYGPTQLPSAPTNYDGCFVVRAGPEGFTVVEPLFRDLDRGIVVERVAGDGNCLFHAFAVYLGEEQTHQSVRRAVSNYLADHAGAEFVQTHISFAIEDHNERCVSQQRNQAQNLVAIWINDSKMLTQKLAELSAEMEPKQIKGSNAYIERVSEDGFFGGDVEIYAFAQQHNVPVGVYELGRDGYTCSLSFMPNGAEDKPPCLLIYDRMCQHYNIYRGSLD